MKKIDLTKVIKKTIDLYESNKNINIKFSYNESEDFLIFGDVNQLTRVFTNLINNSIQAIDKKGNIDIALKNKLTDVVIDVIDNGKGIPKELRNHIFEPQFTTKSNGKGLGLPMVFQILLSHKGEIELIENNHQGTCFKIHLPKQVK